MKKIIALGVTLVAALSFAWVGVTHALNVKSGDTPTVAVNETVDGTLYAAGRTVTVAGTVNGDVICAGQEITITGKVDGDVLCAGQTVNVSGTVTGSVRAAAQLLDVSGKVAGSVTAAGQTVTVDSSATVGRDATLVGQTVHNNGTVTRDVVAAGGTFDSNGKAGHNLDVWGSTVSLGSGAVVTGAFTYTSQPEAQVAQGAKVGSTQHNLPPADTQKTHFEFGPAMYVGSVVFGLASLLVTGIFLVLVTPRLLRSAASSVERQPMLTLGLGFMGLIIPPFAAVMLWVTIIGLPLGFVVLLSWIASLLVATAFSAQALGNVIIAKMHWQSGWRGIWGLLLGLLILFVLALIPFVGGFIGLLALLWGLGGLWHAFFTGLRASAATKAATKKA